MPREPALRKARIYSDHLGGALGTAPYRRRLEPGWLRRVKDARVVKLTPKREQGFAALFAAP